MSVATLCLLACFPSIASAKATSDVAKARKRERARQRYYERKAAKAAAKAAEQTPESPRLSGVSYDVVEKNIRADDASSLDELREMAKRGEIPIYISGSAEAREKAYEEFARVYGDPPGILNQYRLVEERPGVVRVEFTTNEAIIQGIAIQTVSYIRRGRMSELSKRGQVNHAILSARKAAEGAASFRGGDGFPNIEFAQKYGGRVLSTAEKNQANREIHSFLEGLFQSPLSKSGQEYVDSSWERYGNGWVRKGSQLATDQRMGKLRDEGYRFRN